MTIEQEIKGLSQKEALEVIAAHMKRPKANLDHLSKVMDKVLGTGMGDEDQELVGQWEHVNRGG